VGAQYTISLKEIIDAGVDIFDFDYPIFDETYRSILEEKIKNHFMFREIGVETIGKFKFNLKARLNEIMPYYNKRYKAQALEQRILDNYDVTETYNRTVTNADNSNSTVNDTGDTKELYSDTPQGRIDFDGTESDYLTRLTKNVQNTTNQAETISNGNGTENWTRTMKGNIGVQTDADAVVKYMSSLVNVDMEVISNLSDLFMMIY
jgi:hypothetical protein